MLTAVGYLYKQSLTTETAFQSVRQSVPEGLNFRENLVEWFLYECHLLSCEETP
jgi:hypothetical protein